MRSSHSLDRVDVIFDDEHAVADAGLVLPATLAQHLELRELIEDCVDLGDAAGRANVGHKAMTLIHSALAGGDCIDDADALRAGDTSSVLGHGVLAPSTLGTFLRSFTWGHARQLDRVSGELLARAWTAGGGPGDVPVTVDVDSTICETYGLAKQGGVFGHTKVRGYHPLVAAIAGTGDVVHCRLRGGNANSGRGAKSFLTETFNRIRAAGATGPVTLRADSGFYARNVVDACRQADVRFSITVRLHKALHQAIAAIPDDAWTPIPYFLDGADVAETTYRAFGKDQPEVRLIVRRVRPTPGTQLALFVEFSYHAFITDRPAPPSNSKPIIAATPTSRTPSATSNTVSDSTICRRVVSAPTPRGSRSTSSRTTCRAGSDASVSASRSSPTRPCDVATSDSPAGSPRSARRATLHFPNDGRGRTRSTPRSRTCAPSSSSPEPVERHTNTTPAGPHASPRDRTRSDHPHDSRAPDLDTHSTASRAPSARRHAPTSRPEPPKPLNTDPRSVDPG